MGLTRVGGDILKDPLNIGVGVTITPDGNVNLSGILTASSLDISGNVTIGGTVTYESDVHVGAGLSVVGVSTLGNTVVGGGTTELVVTGDARITGVLTVGQGSVTIDGSSITGVTTAGIGSVYGVDSINDLGFPTAGPLSNRNLIINGAMTVAQRATSVTDESGSTYYTVDRIGHSELNATDYTFDQEQSTDAPTGFSYSFKNTTATALTDTADSEIRAARYKIEGQDLQHLKYGTADAQTITLSFWVKTSVQGTYVVRFVNNDDTQARRFAGQYIIENDETGLWQYRTITIAGDTNTAIANSNENEFDIFFVTDAGSNRTGGTANQWDDYTSGAIASPGQTAFVGRTVNDYWQITGLQLEVGERSTPFEHESYGQTLAKCQRYFYKIAGNADDQTSVGIAYCYDATNGSESFRTMVLFPTTMRSDPAANAEELLLLHSSSNDITITSVLSLDESRYGCGLTLNSSASSYSLYGAGLCRLNDSTSAHISFNAEL